MEDIDYGAVFGITPEGAEETEAADPSTDTDAAQGEKEQDVLARKLGEKRHGRPLG